MSTHDSESQRLDEIMAVIDSFQWCVSDTHAIRLGHTLSLMINNQFMTISDDDLKQTLLHSLHRQLDWCLRNRSTMTPFYTTLYVLQLCTVYTWDINIIDSLLRLLVKRIIYDDKLGEDTKPLQRVVSKIRERCGHSNSKEEDWGQNIPGVMVLRSGKLKFCLQNSYPRRRRRVIRIPHQIVENAKKLFKASYPALLFWQYLTKKDIIKRMRALGMDVDRNKCKAYLLDAWMDKADWTNDPILQKSNRCPHIPLWMG